MIPAKTILTGERQTRLRALLDGIWLPPIIRPVVFGDMGMVCVDRPDDPAVCSLALSDFIMYAGDAARPSARYFVETTERPCFVLPSTNEWEGLVREAADAKSHSRYTFANTSLDADRLRSFLGGLPPGYEMRRFDAAAVEQAASERWSRSFVENFPDVRYFLSEGVGFGVFHDNRLVSGATSFAVYDGVVEIEVDSHPAHRRRRLATVASAALVLHCLERGLVPHWDAANEASRALADLLGFTLERRYEVVQI